MESTSLIQKLAGLFREAGRAHHLAYLATNGADPEWPLWYADYLLGKLARFLGRNLTKSELVYLLVYADREHKRKAQSADWPTYYAMLIKEHFPLSVAGQV